MIRCLRTTFSARSMPAGRQDRLLLLAALDEPLGLEPLEHLAGGGARDAEHLGDARRDRALAGGAVLADREGEEVDHLEVLVDRVPVARHRRRVYPGPARGVVAGREYAARPCRSRPSTRSSRPARSPGRSRTRCRRGSAKGAVVSVRLGRSATRGVVADVGVEAPPGIEPVARRPPARRDPARRSSTSRCGSPTTTARRLPARSSSSRPLRRAPRGERPSPAARESLEGEPEPERLTGRAAGRGRADRRGARRGRRRARPARRADGQRQDRGLPPGVRAPRSSAASGRSCSCPEIALAPQTVGRFRRRFGDRVAILHSSLGEAERRDERDRIARGRGADRRRRAVGRVRADARRGADRRRRGARHRVQAGVRPAVRRAHRRREARRARGCGRGLRLGDPAARELGAAPAAVARARGSARRCRRVRLVDLRREAGYPLSAPLLERARRAGRGRRSRDPAPQPARRRAGDPLPGVRHLASLPELRRRAHAPHGRARSTATTAGGSTPSRATAPSAAPPSSRGSAPGTQRLEAELAKRAARARAVPARRGRREPRPARRATSSSASARPTGPCSSGRRWSRRATMCRASRSPRSSTRTRASACPDFRAEERTFQLVTQLAGRSGRDAPGRVLVQTFQPDATPLRHAVNHDVAGFLAGELERREALGYPPFRHLVSILVSGPEPGAPLAALRELRARLEGAEARPARPRARAPAPRPPPRAARSRRRRSRGRSHARRRRCSPRRPATMRRDGLTAVVDVDPQSL